MFLSVEQAFVGRECNPISPKNDCVGGYIERPTSIKRTVAISPRVAA